MVFLSTGIRLTVGPFLKPVVADLGIDRVSFSLVVSLSIFLFGALMPVVGRLASSRSRGSLAVTSALTGDIFGRFSVGSIFGLIVLVHQTGAALGSLLGGYVFELSGGYGALFSVASGLLLGAAALSLTIREPARPAPRLLPVAGGR